MALDLEKLRSVAKGGTTKVSGTTEAKSAGGSSGLFWVVVLIVAALYFWGHKSGAPEAKRSESAPAESAPPAAPAAAPSASAITNSLMALVDRVASANERSISEVLSVAQNGNIYSIAAAARAAGRNYSFSNVSLPNDSRRAKEKNLQAIHAFYSRGDFESAYNIQTGAFNIAPMNSEVASNLAVFAFRVGRVNEARKLAIYSLSLPRSEEQAGNVTDWVTLAAVHATIGNERQARAALYVTLGLTSSYPKRCTAAIYAVNNTYGPDLKDATEAMFERIHQQDLSDDPECNIPIRW